MTARDFVRDHRGANNAREVEQPFHALSQGHVSLKEKLHVYACGRSRYNNYFPLLDRVDDSSRFFASSAAFDILYNCLQRRLAVG